MQRSIHRVTAFQQTAPYTLRVEFADGLSRVIDFEGARVLRMNECGCARFVKLISDLAHCSLRGTVCMNEFALPSRALSSENLQKRHVTKTMAQREVSPTLISPQGTID